MVRSERVMRWFTGALIALALLAGTIAMVYEPEPQKLLSDACWSGHLTKAKIAIFCGADVNNHPGGTLPNLAAASMRGDTVMMNYLLSKGANIDQADKFGNTPLSYAAQTLNLAAVEFLISKGANAQIKNKEGGDSPEQLAKQSYEKLQSTLAKPIIK